MMKSAASGSSVIPRAPLLLGLAGLIPFWGLALGFAVKDVLPWSLAADGLALATYAAVIISFLGGIRWGLVVPRSERPDAGLHYVGSIVPSLAAWAMLALPGPWRLACLGATVLVLGPIDRRMVPAGLAPFWFGRLRLILSCGAGAALLLGAWLSWSV